MEKLKSEEVTNKIEKTKDKNDMKIDKEKEKEVNDKNKDNEQDSKTDKESSDKNKGKENKKEGVFSRDFAEKIELTEEEKKLRQMYLKNLTTKETIIRSIILGKTTLSFKLLHFIIGVIFNFLRIREAKYKSDAINAITSKDLDMFIYSIKYHLIITVLDKSLMYIQNIIFIKQILGFGSDNILLKNFLFEKDMVFFDLFWTPYLSGLKVEYILRLKKM
jgi:hypothetical protein